MKRKLFFMLLIVFSGSVLGTELKENSEYVKTVKISIPLCNGLKSQIDSAIKKLNQNQEFGSIFKANPSVMILPTFDIKKGDEQFVVWFFWQHWNYNFKDYRKFQSLFLNGLKYEGYGNLILKFDDKVKTLIKLFANDLFEKNIISLETKERLHKFNPFVLVGYITNLDYLKNGAKNDRLKTFIAKSVATSIIEPSLELNEFDLQIY